MTEELKCHGCRLIGCERRERYRRAVEAEEKGRAFKGQLEDQTFYDQAVDRLDQATEAVRVCGDYQGILA